MRNTLGKKKSQKNEDIASCKNVMKKLQNKHYEKNFSKTSIATHFSGVTLMSSRLTMQTIMPALLGAPLMRNSRSEGARGGPS